MTFHLNIAKLVAVLTATGGVVALVLGALDVGNLTAPVDSIIVGLGGVLVAITSHHATKAATKSGA